MKYGARFSTWLFLMLVIAACSHTRLSDTVDESGTGGTGGARSNAGAGGMSGTGTGGRVTSGSAGRSTAGTISTPTTPAVKCGTTTCPVPGQAEYQLLATLASTFGLPLPSNGAGILPAACCTKEDKNVCGIQVNNNCVARPASDPVCPDVMLFGVTEPGCCLEPQGVCGINGAQSGMGCMDVNSGINVFAGVTRATPCGSGLTKTGEDGGVEPVDAGH